MDTRLGELVKAAYMDRAAAFFAELKTLGLTDAELSAVPSLFLPGWGEEYDFSWFKVAIAGKETWSWGNEYGDTLKSDLAAYDNGKYDVLASCRLFRKDGPAEWRNVFWQYPAAALAKLFGCTKDDVLQKDSPVLRSIAWFNGHALETCDSKGVDNGAIASDKLKAIHALSDKYGFSDFGLFAQIFQPRVILYFYRNQSNVPNRGFPEDIESVRYWGDNNLATEWRMEGRTILLQFPHTTWLRHRHIPESTIADIVCEVLKARGVSTSLCDVSAACDFYRMSAVGWATWVDYVRNEARKYPQLDNIALSRHLMVAVAAELFKRKATMTAQTLVLLLNEVDKFRRDNWRYSKERRGPCTSVRGAWKAYDDAGKQAEADWLAKAFTKLDGSYAWK